MEGNERVYILAPTHNRVEVASRFAACLASQTYRNFHLILIDDGSTDGTAERLASILGDITILRGDGNLWWAGSLQKGRAWVLKSGARPEDLVLMINDDTLFDRDFIGNAVAAMRGLRRTLLLAQQFSLQTGRLVECGVHVDWERFTFVATDRPEEINCMSTRGLFMRVADLRHIGGFHPRLLPHYGSDYEYTMRAYRMGYALATDPKVRIQENEETTGIRTTREQARLPLLHRLFLPRNQQSPYYWSVFVLLACPWRLWPRNLYRVWAPFMRLFARAQ